MQCVDSEDCNDLLLVSGDVYVCEKEVCVAVGYAGDSCGAVGDAPCVGNSTCNGSQCVPRSIGERCIYSEDCGVGGFCKNHVCVDAPFPGEDCGGVNNDICQQGAFCTGGKCQLLFTQGDGQNCTDSVQCTTSSLCVQGKCKTIPGEE